MNGEVTEKGRGTIVQEKATVVKCTKVSKSDGTSGTSGVLVRAATTRVKQSVSLRPNKQHYYSGPCIIHQNVQSNTQEAIRVGAWKKWSAAIYLYQARHCQVRFSKIKADDWFNKIS